MIYLRASLSALAAVVLAGGSLMWAHLRTTQAPAAFGFRVVKIQTLFSAKFGALAALFLVMFFVAGQVGSKLVRVSLFWIPTVLLSLIGVAYIALFAYLSWRS